MRGVPNSVAETAVDHTFEVMLISMYLADALSKCTEVNVKKVPRISLLHDVPEVMVGDIMKPVKSRAPKLFSNAEMEALHNLGLNEYSELLKDLNVGLNPETRFVRLSDTVTTHLQ